MQLWRNGESFATVLVFSILVTGARVASAAGVDDAAASAARQLVEGVRASGAEPKGLLVAPLKGSSAAAADLSAALTRALLAAGAEVVDRAGSDAAIQEAALSEDPDKALDAIAGKLGAAYVISGEVAEHGGSSRANLRVVAVANGTVVASASVDISGHGAGDESPAEEMLSLQAQLRRLSDRIAAGLGKMGDDSRYLRFAVLPFEEVGDATKQNQLGLLVSSELTTLLQRDHRLLMVERGQITKVIDELALSQTGLVDESKSAQIGKLAGAEGLIMGTVSAAGDRYLVNAKVISATNGTVVVAEKTELPAADLVALSSDAVVLRSTMGAVYRSAIIPGWGQYYNKQPVKAAIVIGAEAVAAGLATTFHLLGDGKTAAYRDLGAGTPSAEFRSTREEAISFYQIRDGFIVAAVAIYGLNLLDAFLSGKDYDSATPGGGGGASGAVFAW